VSRFIPVEPEKWAEMVKAMAEVDRLKMEQRLKAVPVEAQLMDRVAKLKAEVERLEKLEEYLQNTLNQYALDDMRLQAKVERLTKAGDDLETWVLILGHNNPTDIEDFRLVVLNWNAAKEGKQL
jgi:predicted nuclease with TOPRIM domain